jgi:hypothetical protein
MIYNNYREIILRLLWEFSIAIKFDLSYTLKELIKKKQTSLDG